MPGGRPHGLLIDVVEAYFGEELSTYVPPVFEWVSRTVPLIAYAQTAQAPVT
jgi:hypothetical protein